MFVAFLHLMTFCVFSLKKTKHNRIKIQHTIVFNGICKYRFYNPSECIAKPGNSQEQDIEVWKLKGK